MIALLSSIAGRAARASEKRSCDLLDFKPEGQQMFSAW